MASADKVKNLLSGTDVVDNLKSKLVYIYQKNAAQGDRVELSKRIAALKVVNIMLVGGTGAGKSSFVHGVTGNDSVKIGHFKPTTMETQGFDDKSGQLRFYDTRGFEEWSEGERALMEARFKSKDAKEQIHVVLFLHNATHRAFPNKMKWMLGLATSRKLPVCFVITNIYAASQQLDDVKKSCTELISECKANVPVFCVNSTPFMVLDDDTKEVLLTKEPKGLVEVVRFVVDKLPADMAMSVLTSIEQDRGFWDRLFDQSQETFWHVVSFFTPTKFKTKVEKYLQGDISHTYKELKASFWKSWDSASDSFWEFLGL